MAAAQRPNYIHWAAAQQPQANSSSSSSSSTMQRRFQVAEHTSLGDALVLTGADGTTPLAVPALFTLPNGLNLTYGDMAALGGDFYATHDPISDGATLAARVARFEAAYAQLASPANPRQPAEAHELLAIAAAEKEAFAAALAAGTDPSAAYAGLADSTAAYTRATSGRPDDQPGYVAIAAINWDHFGADARRAYDAGHFAALTAAAAGDLLGAYARNAFADHFLQDSFAAGHVRVPRRVLHDGVGTADLCAMFMHDEDNAIGLAVTNPKGDAWVMYGDDYLMDQPTNLDNLAHIHNALQISIAEVQAAYRTGAAPTSDAGFGAWAEAPLLAGLATTTAASAGGQPLAPLFTGDGARRADLLDRAAWVFTADFAYLPTLAQLQASERFEYPITMGA